MCGIVGVCGKIWNKEENVFKTLLCLDTIRGPDSTGILAVGSNAVYEIFKKTGTPWNCFGEKGFEKIFKYTNALLLGHNRWATVGTVTDKNAHPFDVENIVGVHNGTIRQEYRLEDHQYFDVDSETVLHNFSKNGVAETVKILDGAFAIVFYDKRDHTVHFLRNKERPLFYVYSKDMKTIFWASEPWMLQIACARYDVEIGPIMDLEVMVEHTLKLPTAAPAKVDGLAPMARSVLVKEEPKSTYPACTWKPKAAEVTPINNAGTGVVTKTKQDAWYKKLVGFVGKDVNFSVSGFVDGKHQKFLRAYAEIPEADVIEIRIFMDAKNKKFNDLLNINDKIWTGHVKRANTLGMLKGYLLIDNRTIKPSEPRQLPNSISPKEKVFNLFHNKPVAAQEWLDATSCGCDNCGEIPQIGQAGELEWYDSDRFFCKTCYCTENVQNYLSLLPNEG